MECNYKILNRTDKKYLVLLEFKRKALLYDLANLGYIITDSTIKKTPEERHNIADITEDGNVDRVTRMMDLAHAKVMDILAKFVEHKLDTDTYGHDVLMDVDSYFVMLNIPSYVPGSAIGVLRTYIHEYIISFVMEDWLMLNGEDASMWTAKKADLTAGIQKGFSKYRKGLVIKQHPFP